MARKDEGLLTRELSDGSSSLPLMSTCWERAIAFEEGSKKGEGEDQE